MVRIAVICAFLVWSCNSDHHVEKDFFHKYAGIDRVARMRQYTLEDQYKIFRYGNDKIEPPDFALATPLAEKGAAAIPFLTEQIKSSTDDLAVRDILLVLETMVHLKTYDVKADNSLLTILDARIKTMKNTELQVYARGQLLLLQNRSYTLQSPEPVLPLTTKVGNIAATIIEF